MRLAIDMHDSAEMLAYRWRLVSKKDRKKLYDAAQEVLGYYGELRLGAFLACSHGDFSCIGVEGEEWYKATNAQYLWAMGFKDYVKSLCKTMQSLAVPMTPEQQQAQSACLRVSLDESLLVFVRSYFDLGSFREAEAITMNEVVIAKRDAYNRGIYECKLQQIINRKYDNHRSR